ncbi:MAG: sialidase family protein [Spirochaetota bacterium]
MKYILRGLRILAGCILFPVILISLLILYWDVRKPPQESYDPSLQFDSYIITTSDDPLKQHNSNTDLIYHEGYFYCIHAQTKWHLFDNNGYLLIRRSADAKTWQDVAKLVVGGKDVRDPKFAVIKNKLFVYFLVNEKFDPSPHTTYWSLTKDGLNWSIPEELTAITVYHRTQKGVQKVTQGGWNLWRPKTRDNKIWHVIASGKKPLLLPTGQPAETDVSTITVLLSSTDGLVWKEVSEVYTAYGNGEPELEFLPDGSIIATLRCGSLGTGGYEFGNPTGNTTIAIAQKPYTKWSYAHSFITRLDGATLFSINGRIFAAGRNHLGPRFDMGNHVAKKRTGIYEVLPDRLIHLFDLPSNGDTAYTGVVVKDGKVYVSYYTCPVDKDYPWIIGICFKTKTDVRMATFTVKGLLKVADSKRFTIVQ